ncbi:MAG: hypothetical protein ABIO84_05700 [Lysobacter sp.]
MFNPMTIAMAVSIATLLGSSLLPAKAQQSAAGAIEQWGFDPSALVADGHELLLRAPDSAIDRVFQAARVSLADPNEAAVLCPLFDPGSDRSLAALNEVANRLGPEHSSRFAGAVANLFVAAVQSPRQPFDKKAALQGLKSSGVRAALINDGFVAGLNGSDQQARCRSIRWLMDDLHGQPLQQRAAVTRLLLAEGLGQLADASGAPGKTRG